MRGKTMRKECMREIWKATLLVGALFLSTLGARAQGSRKQDIVLNRFGQPVAGATVTVCTAGATGSPCSPLATIFSNVALNNVQSNPFTTDGLGNYNFYAAPGRYQIQFSGAGLTSTTIPDVILPCDPSNCSASSMNVTNGISAFSLSLSGNLAVSGSVTTGNLNPTSLSTSQAGASPAQVGPHWYPGTGTGLVTPPASAPSVFVDATVTGSLDTTTYKYEIVYRNLNGRTTPSPVTTFAAPSGATNAIDCRPAAADYTWRSGGFEYECYVSNDGGATFHLQTPYANATHTTAHYVPGDAIFQSYSFATATAPVTNTAVIDPLQVALNAACNFAANSCPNGMLMVPQGAVNLTTPLVVSNLQKLIGAQSMRTGSTAGPSSINSAFADLSVASVMVMGTANGWSIDGVDISNSGVGGNALMLMGAGPGFQSQNMKISNSSLQVNQTAGTGCALLFQGTFYNFISDSVYFLGDKASVCVQYGSGGGWEFRGSRWDDHISAWVSTTGFTDRDHGINYAGFPNDVGNIRIHDLFTESGTGIVFDAVNTSIKFGPNFFTSDTASAPGTAAIWRVGCDSFCANPNAANALVMRDSFFTGSGNFTQAILFAANSSNAAGPLIIENSQVGGNINVNSFNIAVYVYGPTDLCLDPACNASDGSQITNRFAGYNTIYAQNARGARDGSGVYDYISLLGRKIFFFPQDNWAGKRRVLCIDSNTDNSWMIRGPADDNCTSTAGAHIAGDSVGNLTMLGTLTWNGGNKISKVLQAQTALTFGAIAAQTCGNQTVTLTGAATTNGAFASPNYAVEAGLSWSAFVSASNTITVRACNVTSGSITPAASSNWRVWVVQE